MEAEAELYDLRESIDTIFNNIHLNNLFYFLPLIFSFMVLDIKELSTHTLQVYNRLTEPYRGDNGIANQESPEQCITHICDTFHSMVCITS